VSKAPAQPIRHQYVRRRAEAGPLSSGRGKRGVRLYNQSGALLFWHTGPVGAERPPCSLAHT
jgi:hypothetical protein